MPEKIIAADDGTLRVSDEPIIPFIEGDGTGVDIWPAAQKVMDAAAAKHGKKIAWKEVLAGQKAFDATGNWLPDETVETFKEYLIGIKGPLTTPVIPSVFPIVNVAGAKRFSAVNGTEFPQWLADRVDPLADDPEELRTVGVEIATDLAQQLLDRGVPGLHIYTLNRPNSATTIWNNLGLTARR